MLDPSPSPSRARQARRRPAGPRRRMMTRTAPGKRNRAPPLPDGALSDMVNLSRAKDAAAALVLAGLNEAEESVTGRPRMRVRRPPLPTRPSARRPLYGPRAGKVASGSDR